MLFLVTNIPLSTPQSCTDYVRIHRDSMLRSYMLPFRAEAKSEQLGLLPF